MLASQPAVDVDTDFDLSQLAECMPLANHIVGRGTSLMQGQERSSETSILLTDR